MNLGVVLCIVGRYEESEKYLKESYEGSRKVWGDQDVKTANCMQNLALLSEARGLHFDAKAIYDKCIALYTALLGPSHLSTLEARCNSLGNDFHLGEKFAATRGMEKVLQEKKEKLGEFNVSTLNAADNLACMYMKSHDKDDFKLAGELFKSVEDNLISRLGEEHFEVAKTRENMSIWYAKSGMLREAVEYKLKATVVYEKVMGEKCEKVQQMKHWMMTWENRMKFFQATGNKRAK
jgi:tetratricopeptide (TPR) repeat protein